MTIFGRNLGIRQLQDQSFLRYPLSVKLITFYFVPPQWSTL